MRKHGEVGLDRYSAERQLEAAHLQLQAALIGGNAADIAALRQHAHNLLDQVMDRTVETIYILKAGMLK